MRQVTRVTIALPNDLWEKVKRSAPADQRSGLVATALESELRRRQWVERVEALQQHQKAMHKKYGTLPAGSEAIEQMRQERDDERHGLR